MEPVSLYEEIVEETLSTAERSNGRKRDGVGRKEEMWRSFSKINAEFLYAWRRCT
jgi:hypothetical protein